MNEKPLREGDIRPQHRHRLRQPPMSGARLTMNSAAVFLFASSAGEHDQAAESVFYKTEGEGTAEELCGLFAREYGGPNGLTFHHAPAASISTADQVLLDEAIQWLEVCSDPAPGVYDPPPTKDIMARAQYAARAQEWEALLRKKAEEAEAAKSLPPKGDTKAPPLSNEGDKNPLTKNQSPGTLAATGAGTPLWMKVGGKRTPMLLPRKGYHGWSYSIDMLREIARSDNPVLLTGETGTGKELLAQYLHDESKRKGQPFVPVNCSAFSTERMEGDLFGWVRGSFSGALVDHPGPIAEAEGGTLFLDEIGNLDANLQGYLLRFMQSGEYRPLGGKRKQSHVRVIAATSKLGNVVEDLKHRFHFQPVELPALRDRGGDIFRLIVLPGFIDLQKFTGITLPALCRLVNESWPGNIRELARYCEQKSLASFSAGIDLPSHVFDDLMPKSDRDQWHFFASFCLRLLEGEWRIRRDEFCSDPHIANTTRLLLTLAGYNAPSDNKTDLIPITTLAEILSGDHQRRYAVYDFRFLNEALRDKTCEFDNDIARKWGDCALPDALVLIRDYVRAFVRIVSRTSYPDTAISEDFENFINGLVLLPSYGVPAPPPPPIEISTSKVRVHSAAVVKQVVTLSAQGVTPKEIQKEIPQGSLSISQIKGIIYNHREHTGGRPKSRGGRPKKTGA
jgi:sigma-54 specific flagellar transcriptional regulator A